MRISVKASKQLASDDYSRIVDVFHGCGMYSLYLSYHLMSVILCFLCSSVAVFAFQYRLPVMLVCRLSIYLALSISRSFCPAASWSVIISLGFL